MPKDSMAAQVRLRFQFSHFPVVAVDVARARVHVHVHGAHGQVHRHVRAVARGFSRARPWAKSRRICTFDVSAGRSGRTSGCVWKLRPRTRLRMWQLPLGVIARSDSARQSRLRAETRLRHGPWLAAFAVHAARSRRWSQGLAEHAPYRRCQPCSWPCFWSRSWPSQVLVRSGKSFEIVTDITPRGKDVRIVAVRSSWD